MEWLHHQHWIHATWGCNKSWGFTAEVTVTEGKVHLQDGEWHWRNVTRKSYCLKKPLGTCEIDLFQWSTLAVVRYASPPAGPSSMIKDRRKNRHTVTSNLSLTFVYSHCNQTCLSGISLFITTCVPAVHMYHLPNLSSWHNVSHTFMCENKM